MSFGEPIPPLKIGEVVGSTKLEIGDIQDEMVGCRNDLHKSLILILLNISAETTNIVPVRYLRTRGPSQKCKQAGFLGWHLKRKAPPEQTGI